MAVIGNLPSWLDIDFARNTVAVLAIAAVVCVVLAAFVVRSVAVRVVAVLVLGAAVFGLLHYRAELDHCDKSGCACRLFGEDIHGGGCSPTR